MKETENTFTSKFKLSGNITAEVWKVVVTKSTYKKKEREGDAWRYSRREIVKRRAETVPYYGIKGTFRRTCGIETSWSNQQTI